MAWWPWGRPGGEPVPPGGAPAPAEQPTPPVQRSGEWAELPPLQRVLEQAVAPVAPLDVFRADLATSRDPRFLAPLTHRVDPSAGGLVDGIAGAAAPRVHPVGNDLPVPPRPSATTPGLQRRVGGWSSPAEVAVPASVAERPAEPQDQLTEPGSLGSAVARAGASPAVTPQTMTPQAMTPVEAAPVRSLTAVNLPDPPRAERPPLPLAELPVVSRLGAAASGSAPANLATPRSEQRDHSAPLSGFAAAIAAIERDDEAAPTTLILRGPAAPNEMPVQRSALGASEPQGSFSQPAGPAALSQERAAGRPAGSRNGFADAPGALHDLPLLGDQPVDTGPAQPPGHPAAADPDLHDPASGELRLPDLPVVPRAADHDAAPATEPTIRFSATPVDAPTLGASTSSAPTLSAPTLSAPTQSAPALAASASPTSTAARPVTASPVLQRRTDVVPAQPVRFLPVATADQRRPTTSTSAGSPAGSGAGPLVERGPARPAVALQRWTGSPGSVRPPPAAAEIPRPMPTSEPAAALQRLPDQPRPPAAPPPAALLTALSRNTSFAQMFSAGRSDGSALSGVPEIQREVAPDPPAAEPEPAPTLTASPDPSAAGSAPSLTAGAAATTATTAAAAAAKPADIEDLARRLYEPLSARLRAELWLDRERAGV